MSRVIFEIPKYSNSVPCRLYLDYSSKRHDYTSNWHREFEIIYVVSGEDTIYIENECINAVPGDIVVINRGRIHAFTSKNFSHHCLIPSDSVFESLGIIDTDIQIQAHIRDPEISSLFLDIIKEFQTDGKYSFQCRLLSIQKFFLKLFDKYETNYAANIDNKNSSEFIITTKVINYLRKHLSENFSIDEIANEIGVTTPHMCRCVKATTGLSILDHLNIIRCYTAKHLLTHTNKKVSEIATLCGYGSSSYFARNYKKVIGISPSDTPKF